MKIVTWNSVFLIALFLRVAISTTRTFILNHFPDMGAVYSFVSFLLIDVFILSWQIYGVQLFSEKINTCSAKAPVLYYGIMAFLGLGLIQISIYFFVLLFQLGSYLVNLFMASQA